MTDETPTADAATRRTLRRDVARLFGNARRSSTRGRVVTVALAAFLPVVVVAFLLSGSLSRTAAFTGDVRDQVEQRIAPVLELTGELAETGVLVDRYFASGADHDLAALRAQSERVDRAFADLLGAEAPRVQDAERRVAAALDSWRFVTGTIRDNAFVRPEGVETRAGLQATISSTLGTVRSDLADVTAMSTTQIVAIASDAEASARRLRTLLWVTVVVAGLLSITTVLWLLRDLRRATRALIAATERVHAGDLTHRVPDDIPGDLAVVGHAFNAMAERIERQNGELHSLASHDPLTAVANRRGFTDELTAELERSIRYSRPTALLLLDIDHFKLVNDRHGHPAGDVVLKAVADEIVAAVRNVDTVSRWGGEEFAVLLPETDVVAATHVAQRINRVIAERVVLVDGAAIRVTASLGMALFDPTSTAPMRPEELVAHADQALYEAKDTGRNRVVLAASLRS